MFQKFLISLRGAIGLGLYSLDTLFWPIPIFIVALIRLIPIPPLQRACSRLLHAIPTYWSDINALIIRSMLTTEFEIHGLENLKTDEWYMMISNHSSWADIIVLEHVFNRQSSPLRIFMKRELLWQMPLAGIAAKLVNFPTLHRHSKEYIAKHPEQKNRDIIATQQACERFKLFPTTVLTFAEGTRFTAQKRDRQNSPYKNLLRPRAGGIAFTLNAMGKQFKNIINVTVVYSLPEASIFDFYCNKIKKITVYTEVIPITDEIVGNYEEDREFRIKFQAWLNRMWQRKDILIDKIKNLSIHETKLQSTNRNLIKDEA